jgi:hypothetical protein
MGYRVERGFQNGFGRVERILVGDRCVGLVYPHPNFSAETGEEWMAFIGRGRGAETREEAILIVLRHASGNPGFDLG